MIYVIAAPCVTVCDTACVDVCPVDCIHGPMPIDENGNIPSGPGSLDDLRETLAEGGEEALTKKYGAKVQLYIDPEECISCGACEPECPVEAIFEDEELPEKWNDYIEINAAFFRD